MIIYVIVYFSGPWDLEIQTNAIIYERAPLMIPHPHPEVEAFRCQLAMKLRQCYQDLCHSREGNKLFHNTYYFDF